jgi:hypothetical protein
MVKVEGIFPRKAFQPDASAGRAAAATVGASLAGGPSMAARRRAQSTPLPLFPCFSGPNARDPGGMTPVERLREIAQILARGAARRLLAQRRRLARLIFDSAILEPIYKKGVVILRWGVV